MVLYLESKTRPDIYFYVNQYARFNHNTKSSHNISVKIICWYLQGTKDKGLVFNICKRMVVDCYADEYFAGLWVHENPPYQIFAERRNGFVI